MRYYETTLLITKTSRHPEHRIKRIQINHVASHLPTRVWRAPRRPAIVGPRGARAVGVWSAGLLIMHFRRTDHRLRMLSHGLGMLRLRVLVHRNPDLARHNGDHDDVPRHARSLPVPRVTRW